MSKQTTGGYTHETSPEIIKAIVDLGSSERTTEAIFSDPTPEELLYIWENATKNELLRDNTLYWGDSTLREMMQRNLGTHMVRDQRQPGRDEAFYFDAFTSADTWRPGELARECSAMGIDDECGEYGELASYDMTTRLTTRLWHAYSDTDREGFKDDYDDRIDTHEITS